MHWLRALAIGIFGLAVAPFVLDLIVSLGFLAAGYQKFLVPSSSMAPALLIGDRIFARRASADGMVARGDVVAFRHPVSEAVYIKRVIALPTERVQMQGGVPVIDGTPLEQVPDGVRRLPFQPIGAQKVVPRCKRPVSLGDFCEQDLLRETHPDGASYVVLDIHDSRADDTALFEVPEDHVFVLGDNRDNALDSRFVQSIGGVGMVPMDRIIAIGSFVEYSIAQTGNGWVIRWDRFGKRIE